MYGSWLEDDRRLFLIALLVRLVVVLVFLHERGLRGGLEPGEISDNIVAGRGFVFHFYGSDVPRLSFLPPLYPWLLAGLKLTFGGAWVWVLQVLQCLIGAFLPVLVRRLAVFLTRADLAWAAAYLAAVWPPLVVYASDVFSVTLHAVGVTALLYAWVRSVGRDRWIGPALATGAGYGLLGLSLPSFLGSLALMPLGLRGAGLPWRRALGAPALAILMALVVLSPWLARNAVVHDRFVPVATNLGFNLAGANNPYARPHVNVLCARDEIRWRVIDRHALDTMNEVEFDRMLLRQGIDYMAQHPGETLERLGTRALYFWWINPRMWRYNRLQGLGGLMVMSALTPLFVIGVLVSWRMRRQAPFAVLYATIAWMTLFYMNFAVRGRYNLAIQPVMLLFAVLGVAAIGRRLRSLGHAGDVPDR